MRYRRQLLVLGVACGVLLAGDGLVVLTRLGGDARVAVFESYPPVRIEQGPVLPTVSERHSSFPNACVQSFDSACGAFQWVPDPGPNTPATISISHQPVRPRAGTPVAFRFSIADRDAAIMHQVLVGFGDGTDNGRPGCSVVDGSMPFALPPRGAWRTPARIPGSYVTEALHVYRSAGTYTVTVRFWSGGWDPRDPDVSHRDPIWRCESPSPYANYAKATFRITVLP